MQIDEIPDVHSAARSRCALAVEVAQNVHLAADVEVAVDAASYAHPAVHRRRHQHYATCPTGGVERLVKTVVATVCITHVHKKKQTTERQNKLCAWRHNMPPPLSSPVGAQAPRAPPSRRNVAAPQIQLRC